VAAACALLLAAPASSGAQIPGREADPVVLKGAQLPDLLGAEPGAVVAFRWTGSDWDQIPVQVDERAAVAYNKIYNFTTNCDFGCTFAGTNDVYTDPETWTGPDPDPAFDAGDELALMSKDSGTQGPSTGPAGVAPGARVQLELTDPLSGQTRYVYLFRSAGALSPGAGASYVDYDFNLTSGDYKTTYAIASGPNPETSSVETAYYRHNGLTDRWFDRSIEVLNGGATGVDILDGDKHQFDPSTCGRSETTFSNGEGAFIVNKSGPVRAIRSYYGANSGPLTQKTHVYYERRSDVLVNLRVHGIPGVMAFLDLSPAATGMAYRDPANTSGLTIDGSPETATAISGPQAWAQVTGDQGTLDVVSRLTTDVSPITLTSYWLDDTTPTTHQQCSGDAEAWGLNGTWITSSIPNTDPQLGAYNNLSSVRSIYYDPPNQPAGTAIARAEQVDEPLGVTVTAQPDPPSEQPDYAPAQPTGKRKAALRKCKRAKTKKKRAKCRSKARKLPV
jgi:hypothetical protein